LRARPAASTPSKKETSLVEHPGWIRLRTKIAKALENYPDARRAVEEALLPEHGTEGRYL
jgi:hypothetical protein